MGRKTYEFGYLYGLELGQLAYPHMEHYIFSDSLYLENTHDQLHIETLNIERIQEIREHSSIDILKLKINPIVLGDGVTLFGDSKTNVNMHLTESALYDNGLQIVTYELIKKKSKAKDAKEWDL